MCTARKEDEWECGSPRWCSREAVALVEAEEAHEQPAGRGRRRRAVRWLDARGPERAGCRAPRALAEQAVDHVERVVARDVERRRARRARRDKTRSDGQPY